MSASSSPPRRLASPRLRLLLASVCVAALSAPARADDAPPLTTEQRQSLDKAVGLWGMGLLGGDYGAPYSVIPEGDRFRVEVLLDGPIGHSGARVEGGKITASATSLDGGRWAFDDLHYPASFRLIKPPAKNGAPGDAIAVAQQSATRTSHVVIDPSLTTISSIDSSATGVVIGVASDKLTLDIKADRTTAHSAWQPASDGRVDVTATSAADGVTYSRPGDDGFNLTMHRLTSESHSLGFAPGRMADAVRAALQLIETMPAPAKPAPAKPAPAKPAPTKMDPADPATPPPKVENAPAPDTGSPTPGDKTAATPPMPKLPPLTAAQRVVLHGMIDALHDAYGSVDQAIAVEGVAFASRGHDVTLQRLALSQSLAAPGGKADIKMRIAVDCIDSPQLPPGSLHDLVPHHVVLAPHFSGMPVNDLLALISKAVDSDDPKAADFAADGTALLARSPVTAGLDELAFDMGPAKLAASGSIRTSGPEDIAGNADIKVTGLDALIQQASNDPLLRQGTPVLIFLKGIGQQNGDVVTWKIAFANHKLTVNGADMSQMIPHGR